MPKSKLTDFFTRGGNKSRRNNLIVAAALAALVLGVGIVTVLTRASGFFVAAEPETATLTGNAQVINDASASGGKAVQFTTPVAPPPPPPSGGSCSGAASHVPGGADGTGTCWPGANNTGVPSGTNLTNYTGSCTISAAGTVIDAKTITCPGDLLIRAANVTIKNSKVNGFVVVDTDANNTWSLTIQDSEVVGGSEDRPSMSNGNITATRVKVHGGHNGLECQEHSTFCTMQDSYVYGQYMPPVADPHLGGILVMAGNNIRFEHNTVACDAINGCSGDINLIPYYDPPTTVFYITGAKVIHNLMIASIHLADCTKGGSKYESHGTNIVYQNNVFQRGSNRTCGAYEPVANFEPGNAGNEWTNNKWDDGTTVEPVDQIE